MGEMNEPFGTVVSVIIVVFALFFVQITYDTSKTDMATNVHVYKVVNDFVDEVELNGYISQDMYNNLQKKLSDTGVMYTIEMTHSHAVVSPVFNENGDAIKGTKTSTVATYEDEILDKLYDTDGMYYLEANDYFSITVKNKTRTLAQKLNRIITGTSTKYAVVVVAGGVVRNENY